MKYSQISAEDQETIASSVVSNRAEQAERQALSTEFETARMLANLSDEDKAQDWVKVQQERATNARKEANAFIKASKIPAARVKELRSEYYKQVLHGFEATHLGIAAQMDVLEQAGLPVEAEKKQLADLEAAHKQATDLLNKV